MRRRDLLRTIAGVVVAAAAGPRLVVAEGEPDRRPLSADNPRIWPPTTRLGPLPMGAVDAFRAPERAAEMGVQWQRIMFDWSAIQRRWPEEWSLGWSNEEMARRERDAGRPMIGQFI